MIDGMVITRKVNVEQVDILDGNDNTKICR